MPAYTRRISSDLRTSPVVRQRVPSGVYVPLSDPNVALLRVGPTVRARDRSVAIIL